MSRRGFTSRAIKKRREAIRRIAAVLADIPFNVPIRRVYIFNWSLKFTLVTPAVAATEAISCANKLHWIKLYDGAWMKFIVSTPFLIPVTSIPSSPFSGSASWLLAKRFFQRRFSRGFTFSALRRSFFDYTLYLSTKRVDYNQLQKASWLKSKLRHILIIR